MLTDWHAVRMASSSIVGEAAAAMSAQASSKLQNSVSWRSSRRKARRTWDVVADSDGYVTLHDGIQVPLRRHAPYFFLLPYERSDMLSFAGGILTIHLLHVTDINQNVLQKLFPHLFTDTGGGGGSRAGSNRNSSINTTRSSRLNSNANAAAAISAAAVLAGETQPNALRALAYYVRLDMGEKTIVTRAVHNVAARSTQFIIDVLKHIPLTLIIPEELHDSNTIKLELIAYEHDQHKAELSQHKLIGRSYVHLYNCIHHVVTDKSLRLAREAAANVRSQLELGVESADQGAERDGVDDVTKAVPFSRQWTDDHDTGDLGTLGLEEVGRLHAKICFAYGRYGFGCSNQLHDDERFAVDFVKHSQFPRIEPRLDRRCVEGNIMPPKNDVDIQKLLPFRVPALRIGNLQLVDETVPQVLNALFDQSKSDVNSL